MSASATAPKWAALLDGWQTGTGPLYQRLAAQLRAAVQRGSLVSGEQVPAERVLARALGVSRATVVAAYDTLSAESLLERRRGSGTRIAASVPRRARVMTLRTPRVEAGEDLDFTVAVPWLDDDQRSDLRRYAVDAFDDHNYHPLGLPELRGAIAAMYSAGGLATEAEQILVTTGAQQAIALSVATLVRPGDTCVLETPTFFGAIDVCRAAHARLVGLDAHRRAEADVLADCADAFERTAPRWCFLTPAFHNPTGALMPVSIRRGIAELVAAHQVPLVEDETLADLSFGVAPGPSIASLAPSSAQVISVGSLSKLYWAGLRVGWLRANGDLLPRLAQAKTLADFGGSGPSQRIAVHLVENLSGLRERRRLATLPARDLLADLLAERLPRWRFQVPLGGQFLWVELPTSNATGYTQVAARHGVRVFPGAAMFVEPTADCWLRLPFTMPSALLPEAVERMAVAWQEFVTRDGGSRLS